MDLLLDVPRWRMDDAVGSVQLVLAAPEELRIEVAVAPVLGDARGGLLFLLQHRLELGGRDVRPLGLLVAKRLDGLRVAGRLTGRGDSCSSRRSVRQVQVRGDGGEAPVPSPQRRGTFQGHGSKEVNVDVADAAAHQASLLDDPRTSS